MGFAAQLPEWTAEAIGWMTMIVAEGPRAIEDMNLFEHLEQWAHENTSTLTARGLHLSINYGPADREKRVARIDMDSPTRLVQLLLWDSGEAELLVAELEGDGDLIANEHLEMTSRFGLVEALTSAVAWAGAEAVDP